MPTDPGVGSGSGVASSLLFGQRHSYSVVLRGNGEALVYGRLTVTNPSEQPMSTFSFSIPGAAADEVAVLEVSGHGPCISYSQPMPECVRSADGNAGCLEYDYPQRVCNGYQKMDLSYGGWPGDASYRALAVAKEGNLYKATFSEPIPARQSAYLVMAYAARGYVTKSMGVYSFAFKTPQVPARVEDVSVGVEVDSEFVLRGARSSVDYQSVTLEAPTSMALDASLGMQRSAELDRFVPSIGRGQVSKSAKKLAPNESLIVTGQFAASAWQLNWGRIVVTLLVLLAICVGIALLVRWRRSHRPIAPVAVSQATFWDLARLPALGLLALALVSFLTLIIKEISDTRVFRWSSDPVSVVAGSLVAGLLYVAALFGPAVWAATKYRPVAFLKVVGYTVAWIVVLYVLYLLLIGSGGPRYY